MALDPITAVADLVKTGLDKFIPDKMDEGEKAALKQQMEMFVAHEARSESAAFRNFVVAYEGAAKDVPQMIVILRALIRPAFTILVGWLDWVYFSGSGFTPEQGELLKAVNIIVLFFWFGERAVIRTGLIDIFLGR